MERTSEIVARFQLTPELWYAGSRFILRRQHRGLTPRVVWPVVAMALGGLTWLDFRWRWFDDGLLPVLILLNALVPLGCGALLLTPVLIHRRFDAVYRRLPAANREVVWRFSPFGVSAEGGLTRFDGGWDDLREIVATPDFFLIFRKEKSASIVPVGAFGGEEAVEDFVFLARTHAPRFVEVAARSR